MTPDLFNLIRGSLIVGRRNKRRSQGPDVLLHRRSFGKTQTGFIIPCKRTFCPFSKQPLGRYCCNMSENCMRRTCLYSMMNCIVSCVQGWDDIAGGRVALRPTWPRKIGLPASPPNQSSPLFNLPSSISPFFIDYTKKVLAAMDDEAKEPFLPSAAPPLRSRKILSRPRLLVLTALFLCTALYLSQPLSTFPLPFTSDAPIPFPDFSTPHTYPAESHAHVLERKPRRVAIIGAGASGSSAAWFLSRAAGVVADRLGVEKDRLLEDIVVFDREERPGGRESDRRFTQAGTAGIDGRNDYGVSSWG